MLCLIVVPEQDKETVEILHSMVSAALRELAYSFKIALTILCLVIQQEHVIFRKNSSLVAMNGQVVLQVVTYV